MVVIVLQVAAQLLLGVYVLDADWPERPLALAFAILLGSAAFAAFGLVGDDRRPHGGGLLCSPIYLPTGLVVAPRRFRWEPREGLAST